MNNLLAVCLLLVYSFFICICQDFDISPSEPRASSDLINWDYHHDYELMNTTLHQIAEDYPEACHLTYVEPLTNENRKLFVMIISDNPTVNEPGEPEFKYIANMHGDEVVGRELMLRLIYHLCSGYGKDEEITELVDSLHIFIMPSMNPDGYERGRRTNAKGVDLNRDFKDQFNGNPSSIEPEVHAVMSWIERHDFMLSANLHGGSVVANYPFDGNSNHRSGEYSACKDDEAFKNIAYTYAKSNPTMKNNREFHNGITNGAEWYVLYGGMQDWNYLWNGCMELTLELSYTKWPSASSLSSYWRENQQSLIDYMKKSLEGIHGVVSTEDGCSAVRAKVYFKDASGKELQWVRTDRQHGDFHKFVLPGVYEVTVKGATCEEKAYNDKVISQVTVAANPAANQPLEIVLSRSS
eukprot:CAMPEP_0174250604 /NCGR_PEP_ID=MMETSP0439-20130205/733_1 /TAXON_ID=0 /ORGANISM="Stereomyxa ramosa, Strain Chinc5" /LENGTH=409 /DNA_ID=CAMNT_0015330727 /DNA_START=18 /DNA_END=1247 /DNA_ORIENTATION=+